MNHSHYHHNHNKSNNAILSKKKKNTKTPQNQQQITTTFRTKTGEDAPCDASRTCGEERDLHQNFYRRIQIRGYQSDFHEEVVRVGGKERYQTRIIYFCTPGS